VARGDQRLVILYDGECGFCAWGIAWLLRFDRARQLRPVAIQSEEGARLLEELSQAERLASWHACEEGGPVSSGGAALAPAPARGRCAGWLGGALPTCERVAVSPHRHPTRGLGRAYLASQQGARAGFDRNAHALRSRP
jgi:hypothetical protein